MKDKLMNINTFEDSEDVEFLKINDFDMVSPKWLKHGL
jgi:hypothetical protein